MNPAMYLCMYVYIYIYIYIHICLQLDMFTYVTLLLSPEIGHQNASGSTRLICNRVDFCFSFVLLLLHASIDLPVIRFAQKQKNPFQVSGWISTLQSRASGHYAGQFHPDQKTPPVIQTNVFTFALKSSCQSQCA